MNTTIELERNFRDVITELVRLANTRQRLMLRAEDDVNEPLIVREGLERALVDGAAMHALMRHLEKVKLSRPLRFSEPLTDEQRQAIVARGLVSLSSDQLAELAVNPLALLNVRDALADEDVTDYWWPLVAQRDPDAKFICEFFESRRHELEQLLTADEVASEASASSQSRTEELVAAFGDAPREPTAAPEERMRWTAPFALGQAEWLSMENPIEAEAIRAAAVEVQFIWYPQRQPSCLQVRLGAPLLLTGDVQCVCRLLDQQQRELARSHNQEQSISLHVSETTRSQAVFAEFEYERTGHYRLRFSVKMKPTTD